MNWAEVVREIETKTVYAFSRSSGSGGQNVNKVNTKVTARLRLSELSSLSEEELARVAASLASRLSGEGDLVVQVEEERSQARNRQIALARLLALVSGGLARRRRRLPTHPSAASRRRRIEGKKRASLSKERRRRIDPPADC